MDRTFQRFEHGWYHGVQDFPLDLELRPEDLRFVTVKVGYPLMQPCDDPDLYDAELLAELIPLAKIGRPTDLTIGESVGLTFNLGRTQSYGVTVALEEFVVLAPKSARYIGDRVNRGRTPVEWCERNLFEELCLDVGHTIRKVEDISRLPNRTDTLIDWYMPDVCMRVPRAVPGESKVKMIKLGFGFSPGMWPMDANYHNWYVVELLKPFVHYLRPKVLTQREAIRIVFIDDSDHESAVDVATNDFKLVHRVLSRNWENAISIGSQTNPIKYYFL